MNTERTHTISKWPFLLAGILLLFLLTGWIFYKNISKNVTPPPDLQTTASQKDSTVLATENTSYFNLEAYDNSLYTAKKEHFAAVEEFIESAPRYASTAFIPEQFLKNSTLEQSVNDKDDPFLKNNGANLSNEHYFFNQTVDGIPVFNAQLIVHLRNTNEIYSVQGNLLKNTAVSEASITEEQARETALQKASSDVLTPIENHWDPEAPAVQPQQRQLTIDTTKKYILNKKILGESEDENNYLTMAVLVRNTDPAADPFAKEYFVDLTNGTIVYEQDIVNEALDRQVNCTVGAGCTAGRSEGQPPATSAAINTLYDYIGTYYNFIQQTFQRDSLNGSGGRITAFLRPPCKNAGWNGMAILICSDMNNTDVVYHELTHGLTTYTARLGRGIQSGTLNEGNADIFSIGMQQSDYVMNGANGAVIRDLQNPVSKNQPDTMFSPNFRCPGEVHHESTVMGHAFYLMAEGGTKNNCSISPIGKANALKIQYQALTRYYTATSNYNTHYTALMNACNDLFQRTSSTCRQVQAALAATQIDQQPANTQTAAKCSGLAPKAVVCPAQVNVAPTTPATSAPTKAPTSAQAGPTALPTQAPTAALPTNQQPTQANVPTTSVEQPTVGVPAPTFTCLGSCPTLIPTEAGPTIHITSPVVEQPTSPPAPPQPVPQPSTNGQGGLLGLILQLIRMFFGI